MSQRSIKKQNTLFIPPNFIESNTNSTICDFLPGASLYYVDYPSMLEREHPYRFANDNKKTSDESIYSIFNQK